MWGLARRWDLSRKKGGLTILPPYGRQESVYYRGRLEALGNIYTYIKESKAELVIMTDCDNIASIDYSDIIRYHREKDADVTVVYKNKPITESIHRDVTTISMDENRRVNGAYVNPEVQQGNVLLNVTVIDKRLLERIIGDAASANFYSFTQGVLQMGSKQLKIYGYEYTGYVANINSLQSYFDCNMELLDPQVRRELFPPERPVYTKVRDEVPVKYGINAKAKNAVIADGCVIEGTVENSIIFRGVKIGRGASGQKFDHHAGHGGWRKLPARLRGHRQGRHDPRFQKADGMQGISVLCGKGHSDITAGEAPSFLFKEGLPFLKI